MRKIKDITITPEILKLIAEIDEFKGRWAASESIGTEKLATLRWIAAIESAGSSTRIKGAKLSNAEVEKLLASQRSESSASRDEQEVVGYAEAMDMICERFEAIGATENHIKHLHDVVLKYSSKDQDHPGEYKKVPNDVQVFGADGKGLGVVFETATPLETPGWMSGLVEWFNRSIDEQAHHPLILIGIFIIIFLAIHPFKDGNGRLSRVLTTLLLLRAGYTYVLYSSMESAIERSKESYYLAQHLTRQSIREEVQNWGPWLVFFLKMMVKQKDNLAEKMREEQVQRASLPTLSRQVLELVKTRGEITVKAIGDSTGANRNTIKVHLKRLAEQRYLAQVGKGRGARYTIK